jgi:hypothetical protein
LEFSEEPLARDDHLMVSPWALAHDLTAVSFVDQNGSEAGKGRLEDPALAQHLEQGLCETEGAA